MSQQQQQQQHTVLETLQRPVEEQKEEKVAPVSSLLFGKPLKRREDPRLLTGTGKYVDDIKLPNLGFGFVVRSPYAHATIKSIDTSAASSAEGVRLILTSRDLPESVALPVLATSSGVKFPRPVLAREEVCFYGEAVAFIVADSREHAEEAAELIKIDYSQLEPLVDLSRAMEQAAPRAHLSSETNIALVDRVSFGDVEHAFKTAFAKIKLEQLNQRVAPSPIEPRACLADYMSVSGSLTVWISTQSPFGVRSSISNILQIPENRIRVIGPEVGGGFGAKLSIYPEDLLVCISSMRLGSPVKWVENRTENFHAMTHGRGQMQTIELAADESGKILGLRVKLIGDCGAYLTGDSSDVTLTLRMMVGPYKIPAFEGEAIAVFTNKTLHDAYRGAARPEATFGIERAIDELAREMKIDPAEIRFANFVPKEAFPYDARTGYTYDSGNYRLALERALDYSDYERWKEKQRFARRDGKLVGIGIASYVEVCAFDPDSPQTASIIVHPTGNVTVNIGTFPHGQGHETPFAQIVADTLGIRHEDISVSYGDTSQLPWATYTAGSRSAALGGTAVLMSAYKIKEKMALIAAHALETQPEALVFEGGMISSRTDPTRKKKLTFKEVASLSYKPAKLPDGVEPVLYAFSAFAPKNYTFPFGTHVAVVEIESETGEVRVQDYCSVDDCGRVINPLVVEGQIHGGIVQGLGQALLEGVVYDSSGQLLSASFLDYQIPLAEDVPELRSFRTVTSSPSNPLGVKGIGEAGAIAATAALANAVCDALSSIGVVPSEMPYKPDYLHSFIAAASKAAGGGQADLEVVKTATRSHN